MNYVFLGVMKREEEEESSLLFGLMKTEDEKETSVFSGVMARNQGR